MDGDDNSREKVGRVSNRKRERERERERWNRRPEERDNERKEEGKGWFLVFDKTSYDFFQFLLL